ncbi:MAG: hypothetical protein HS113_17435 [Verrucomicrobiales bacterium]|nr:hypothetical protein [Verrucomicrobiales bacterium]
MSAPQSDPYAALSLQPPAKTMEELEARVEALRNAPPLQKVLPYLEDPAFRRYLDLRFRHHSRRPGVSPAEYLLSKRQGLAERLRGKSLIYIDTNHWLKMRDLELGRLTNVPPEYGRILSRLSALRRSDKVCCPVGAALITELMKQTDLETRRATAALMQRFSGGICLRNWISVAQEELKQHALKTLRGATTPVLVWTKVADVMACLDRLVTQAYTDDEAVSAKATTDVVWKCGVQDYAAVPNWIEATTYFGDAFASESNAEAAVLREQPEGFEKLVRYAKERQCAALKTEMVEVFASAVPPSNDAEATTNIDRVLSSFTQSVDLATLPTLQVLAAVQAAVVMSDRKFRAHDIVDIEHVAQALPYCHVFFCDTPIKNLICGNPLELDRKFGVPVLSTPAEILDYLVRER